MVTTTVSGSVEGGKALKRHLNDIEKQLGRGAHVRVGIMETATYPAKHSDNKAAARNDGLKSDTTSFHNKYGSGIGLPVATVAAWNEFGTATNPERPAIRSMIEKKSPRWGVTLGNILRKNDYDAEKSMALMGELIKGQWQQSIVNWSSPANADSTVKKKGFNKPLVDTAVMLRSVDYQVLDGENSADD